VTESENFITREQFTRRISQLFVESGLRTLPRRQADKNILLKGVSLIFDVKAEYTESEVNEALKGWLKEIHPTLRRLDYVNLRRFLIDREFLGRSKDGSRYWVGLASRLHPRFDPAVDSVDVREVIMTARETIRSRKLAYLKARPASATT